MNLTIVEASQINKTSELLSMELHHRSKPACVVNSLPIVELIVINDIDLLQVPALHLPQLLELHSEVITCIIHQLLKPMYSRQGM